MCATLRLSRWLPVVILAWLAGSVSAGAGPAPREVEGGVLPLSNDGMVPDGVEQAHWPMPFTNLVHAGVTRYADAGGNLQACLEGEVTTTLSGLFVHVNDSCGPISESTSGEVLDLGTSPGTDCMVAPGSSPGNTRSARSSFYELNRIRAMAQGHLPENAWLQQTLTANVNIPFSCGASWNGVSVNFFRAGGGCSNTGELAAVFDHEWGHGMDDNGVNPSISNPSEGIADVYAALRLSTSCIGRGFRATNCGGYGDPCLDCTGVRDLDWAKRASGLPHTVTWIDANCGSGGSAPCGGSVHCESAVYAEALWDLWNRDLPAVYGMSLDTAREVAAQLIFRGAGPVGSWFTCNQGSGGCNAAGGYLNFLAVDDDDGNLANGTPHMQAIFAAFDRHGIACPTPAVQDSGCAGTPAQPPSVAASGVDQGAELVWSAVSGASSYRIYRTDGVAGCAYGKELVGETAATTFTDRGLKNGRSYDYVVIPMGATDTCFGPASACTEVVPQAGGGDPCASGLIFADGFESGDTSLWSTVVP